MKVAITGAAGTIGKALVSHYSSRGDIVYAIDTNENGLYHLQGCVPVLQDISDHVFWNVFFNRNQIDLVINCAAAKQLPIVEQHPFYAFRTNAIGVKAIGWSLMGLTKQPQFVHISTDKAVYPTSLYGFTKFVGEEYAKVSGATVIRLVNVWGSSGSVAEVFTEQQNAGGPLTVTDPHMVRYFIGLEEAVEIITSVKEPGLFMSSVYDTVGIWEIAQRMAEEAGIEIKIIGARPGEKICEDLRYKDETVDDTTGIAKIDSPPHLDIKAFEEEMHVFNEFVKYNALKAMWKWVPEK